MRKISDNPAIQAHYERCLAEGTSETLAEMFALGTPPMSDSDREFLQGRFEGREADFMNGIVGQWYVQDAKRRGLNISGAVYSPGLARFPGDPEAWIRDKSDAKRVLEERGWGSEGAVTVQPRQFEPKHVDLDPAIVQERVDAILADHPEPERVDRVELAEQVYEQHRPKT